MSTSIQTLREGESRRLGFDLVTSMAQHGLRRETERGVWPVLFRHIFVLEDERGVHRHNVYVVDAQRLPVRTSQISDRSMLGTLSAVAKRPVFVDPEFELAGIQYGFSLVVEMTPRPKLQARPSRPTRWRLPPPPTRPTLPRVSRRRPSRPRASRTPRSCPHTSGSSPRSAGRATRARASLPDRSAPSPG